MEHLYRKSMRKIAVIGIALLIGSCGQNAGRKTIGGTQDTQSVNKAGGPPVRDTATINKDRRDSARLPKRPNTSKGNVDPSGRVKNKSNDR